MGIHPLKGAVNRRGWLIAGAGAVAAAVAGRSGAAVDASAFAANFLDMRLRDQDDRVFQPASLVGRVTLFNFVFTGCSTICPIQTRALAEVWRGLSAEVRRKAHFVSVSLDPLADSPAVLKSYARRMEADQPHWRFVTGRPQDIDRLAQTLRLFRAPSGVRRTIDHSTALWLVDRRGRLAQRFSGNPPDAVRLGAELAAFSGS